MKLYELPRNVRIRLEDGLELNFHHVDGSYSYCTDDENQVIHLAAWTEAEQIKEKTSE